MSILNLMDSIKNLEEALKCEVCKNLLDDPLLVAKCGHSLCRSCFMGDFSMKCPICQMPVNTKDSLEDKLLNELLVQLKKLKNIIEKGSTTQNTEPIDVDPEPIDVDPDPVENSVSKETVLEPDEKLQKSDEGEIIGPTAPTFTSSTPKVKRKKKILPKTKFTRHSTEGNQETPGNSEANTSKRKSSSSSTPNENSRSRNEPSPNTSILSSSNLNKRNHKGETLLHRAVIKGDISKVRDLITVGASVNTQDNNGWTPLHEACNHGFVEITKLLLDNGALINVPSQKDNITPIHDALINDQMAIAILLASRGADMHAKTSLGLTALDLCKNDEDRATLIESCSPFITVDVPPPVKKVDDRDHNKIILLHTSLNDKQKEQLEKFAHMIKADVVDSFTSEVTHVITSCDTDGNCTRTMKVLLGILTGKWIMNFQWVEVCLEYKRKVDEEVFEVQGTKNLPNSQGPKQARKNMEQKFPPLFDGFYFYLHGHFQKPTPEREDLLNLIHTGGGKILSREPREETVNSENFRLPYHAAGTPMEGVNHIILYQDKPPRDHHICSGPIRTSQVMWLIECISEFKLKKCLKDNKNEK